MVPRRVLFIGIVVVVLVVVGVTYYILSSGSSTVSSGGSGPIGVEVSVEKGVSAIKFPMSTYGNVTTYNVIKVKEGYQGRLLKLKAYNTGSETYSLMFTLITSKGRQLGLLQEDPGTESLTIPTGFSLTAGDKALLEQAREYPYEMWQLASTKTIATLSPGAVVEGVILYGLQPGEEPAKLHVIATSITTGQKIEFDVTLRTGG